MAMSFSKSLAIGPPTTVRTPRERLKTYSTDLMGSKSKEQRVVFSRVDGPDGKPVPLVQLFSLSAKMTPVYVVDVNGAAHEVSRTMDPPQPQFLRRGQDGKILTDVLTRKWLSSRSREMKKMMEKQLAGAANRGLNGSLKTLSVVL